MEKLPDYGIAIFAIGGVFAIFNSAIGAFSKWLDGRRNLSNQSKPVTCADQLSTVIANNTKAIEANTKSNQELQTVIRVALAEQGGMLDEVLARIREI